MITVTLIQLRFQAFVPALCAVNGNREVQVLSDTLLNIVCYGTCSLCVSSAGIAENNSINHLQLTPNPVKENTLLKWNDNSNNHTVALRDVTGRIMREYKNVNGTSLQIEKANLDAGIYFVSISDGNASATVKLIFE